MHAHADSVYFCSLKSSDAICSADEDERVRVRVLVDELIGRALDSGDDFDGAMAKDDNDCLF